MRVVHILIVVGLLAIIGLLVWGIIHAGMGNLERSRAEAESCRNAGGDMERIVSRSVCFRKGVLDTLIIREFSDGVQQ